MHVSCVSIASLNEINKFSDPTGAIEAIASGFYHRISFVGTTALGRGGVTINLIDSKISGHKIQPIPEELLNQVRHFPLENASEGLKAFTEGEDVLIGDTHEGAVLRWSGRTFEVFGAGYDTETIH